MKKIKKRDGGGWFYRNLTVEEVIDWLKSLRPQSQWKPSSGQIFALRAVVNELKRSDNKYQETIEDLYNDLEKLWEE